MPSQNLIDKHRTPLLQSAIERLAAANIELQISKKRVKNINFRLKPNLLTVSVPRSVSTIQMAQFIDKRVAWALAHHPQVLENYQRKQQRQSQAGLPKLAEPLWLWGEQQDFILSHDKKIALYRQQLLQVMPALFEKWQPIVGAEAAETRIKKMHTRWGSCNTRARRIWLSVYLPAYPIECCEYVIVHELCHLHHANHSREFWQTVATAMPEYKQWHDTLAGKDGTLD
ncbi:YgjP-like metallopeptidase domain-containing protein [uncultured Psychrobacter sp.]|uniref:M48 family metallopeptidase n=1 Tax=uncultured Psychrobacter sp. TaxID=259303 RepID=UPI000C4BB811|nr:YgjP-like metallopeptidase domain-containing protein [uncultured Psychrobacter sp.]MAE40449.1 zinc metalloprotease [Psychrobacter sp.]HAM60641.1 zinc metalloprotease [Psychrobacter sp.]